MRSAEEPIFGLGLTIAKVDTRLRRGLAYNSSRDLAIHCELLDIDVHMKFIAPQPRNGQMCIRLK